MEIARGNDNLATWAKDNKNTLVLEEEVDQGLLQQVLSRGYAPDLSEDELEKIGEDPFIVSYALASLGDITVVTTETPRPTKQRANRHLPDVCAAFKVPCINTFKLIQILDFSTGQ